MVDDRSTDPFRGALHADDPVALYERAPCGYVSTDADGHVVKANLTFLELSGRDRSDVIGRPFGDLLTPGGRIFEQTHLIPMLRMQGAAHEIALDLVRGDGVELPVLVNAATDPDDPRAPIRIAVFDATERRRYERELLLAKERAEESERRARTLARTLQQTLIPPALPFIPGLEVAAGFRPAGDGTEIGGDFYDLFASGRDSWSVLIGDVCGKGAEAAVVTSLARHTVRALAVSSTSPAEVMAGLNDVLHRFGSDRYCTVVLATLQRAGSGWQVRLSIGGHPPPVWVSRTAEPTSLAVRGPLVGIFPDAAYADHEFELAPDQTMLVHTDGITEARGPEGYYGDERLRARVAELGPQPRTLVDGLVDDAVSFQGDHTRDDIAVVAVGMPPAA